MAGVSRWPGMLSPGPAREFTRSPAILTLPGRAVASVWATGSVVAVGFLTGAAIEEGI